MTMRETITRTVVDWDPAGETPYGPTSEEDWGLRRGAMPTCEMEWRQLLVAEAIRREGRVAKVEILETLTEAHVEPAVIARVAVLLREMTAGMTNVGPQLADCARGIQATPELADVDEMEAKLLLVVRRSALDRDEAYHVTDRAFVRQLLDRERALLAALQGQGTS